MPTVNPPSPKTFQADVQKNYTRFAEKDYQASFATMPVAVQKAAKKFAGSDIDVAEFRTKKVDGKDTFAVFVPGSDSGDIEVFSSKGNGLAIGSIQTGNAFVDWGNLGQSARFSKEDVASFKKAFDEKGFAGFNGNALTLGELKGDAAADFKTFQKHMMPDYPSAAVRTTINGNDVVLVNESNDGGSYYGIYNPTSGKRLAAGMASESGEPTWTK